MAAVARWSRRSRARQPPGPERLQDVVVQQQERDRGERDRPRERGEAREELGAPSQARTGTFPIAFARRSASGAASERSRSARASYPQTEIPRTSATAKT